MAAMVPSLVPLAQLQPANALLSASRGLTAIAGPRLGALLVVTVGSGWAVLADAATWLVAAVLLLPVRRHASARAEAGARRRGDGDDRPSCVRDGGSSAATTWLWVVVAGFGMLNAIAAGAWLTLGPALADETIGRQAWG